VNVGPDRKLQAEGGDVLDERVHPRAGIAPHQYAVPDLDGELSER